MGIIISITLQIKIRLIKITLTLIITKIKILLWNKIVLIIYPLSSNQHRLKTHTYHTEGKFEEENPQKMEWRILII